MRFYSTNNKDLQVSFRDALMMGMPIDNGLFMPEYIPDHTKLVKEIYGLDFQDISFILSESMLSEDFKISEIEEIISEAAPNECQPGSKTINRFVLATELPIVSLSNGVKVLGSTTSTLTPSVSNFFAAFNAQISPSPRILLEL